MAGAVTKFQMPEGTSSISVDGVTLPVAKDGTVEVPASVAAVLCESFGAKVWQPSKGK